MAILKSEHTAWDGKKIGNMTQAMVKGEIMEDVIGIPSTTAIAANDVVWLKNYRSSVCIVDVGLSRVTRTSTKDVSVYLCLMGIDPITKEPFMFKHVNEDTEIVDNLGCELGDGSDNAHKISTPITLGQDASPVVSLGLNVCKADKKTVSGSYQVADANSGKVWKVRRESDTLAMIAEWTMKDQYTNAGAATGKGSTNYDPSQKSGYMDFGVGLVFTGALTTAELAELQLQVTLRYKDSMVSETSYGKNYIPVTVSY